MMLIFDVMKAKIVMTSIILIIVGGALFAPTIIWKTEQNIWFRMMKRFGLDLTIIGASVAVMYLFVYVVASKIL